MINVTKDRKCGEPRSHTSPRNTTQIKKNNRHKHVDWLVYSPGVVRTDSTQNVLIKEFEFSSANKE